ncbi:MAG: recombinase family protein, partial [Eggerthellaceae bacterium]|nr:recombinase family protein [Eggerthellaceae bacterium]
MNSQTNDTARANEGGERRSTGTVYGYARVSTRDQNLDRQMLALAEFGVEERFIYADKASGKDFDRPRYRALLRRLREGDTLVVKSIDRLGRNYDEILEEWRHITKKRKAAIVVLDMPLLDTRESKDNLMGVFIADVMLQLLSYMAQVER